MFEPIILAGRFTTTIDGIDNDAEDKGSFADSYQTRKETMDQNTT